MSISSKDILNQWIEAVNSGNAKVLVNLYDENAVLVPTFSSRMLNSKQKRQEYFEKLGTKEDLTVTLHEKTLAIQELEDNSSVLSGLYKWSFSIDGEMLDFEARFTYVINPTKANPILHHHSSQIPRSL